SSGRCALGGVIVAYAPFSRPRLGSRIVPTGRSPEVESWVEARRAALRARRWFHLVTLLHEDFPTRPLMDVIAAPLHPPGVVVPRAGLGGRCGRFRLLQGVRADTGPRPVVVELSLELLDRCLFGRADFQHLAARLVERRRFLRLGESVMVELLQETRRPALVKF